MSGPPKGSSIQRSLHDRDAGLNKISVTTRIVVAASVAATGLFTIVAARAQSGRTNVSGPNAAANPTGSASATNSGLNTANGTSAGDETNLSPPAAPPAPNYGYTSPAAVSGAS